MKHNIQIAAIQAAGHDRGSFGHAWPAIRRHLDDALTAGAELAVLPEGTLPGYVLGYEPFDPAPVRSALSECAGLARKHEAVIVIGSVREEGGRVYNSAIVIDADGSIAGSADKHFLWHFDRQWFAAGERIEPIGTRAGTLGVLVCADGRIPTIARTLVERGAQLLVMPTAWVTSGRNSDQLENAQADLLARVRARENGVPFVAANKCGTELGCVAYCGKSQIVNAAGEVVAMASQHDPETIVARVEVPQMRAARRAPPAVAAHYRSEPARFALTAHETIDGEARILQILEAQESITARTLALDDEAVLDPAPLAAARLRGATFAVWKPRIAPPWQVTFARARALELRMYIAVIDTERRRAYAVDPDGTVIAGTYGGLQVASFAFDPSRTRATAVAPNTDIIEGLTRAAHASR